MKARIFFIIKYWLLWALFFEGARIAFLLSNSRTISEFAMSEILNCLVHGLRMDVAVAAYIAIPISLIVLASIFSKTFQKPVIYLIITGVLLTFAVLITAFDIPLFKAWGYRLDASALRYLSNPKEAWASSTNQPYLKIIILCVVAWLLTYKIFRLLINQSTKRFGEKAGKTSVAFAVLLLIAVLVIPLRGGWQPHALNESSVYFSKNNFLNLAAVNPSFSFLHSLWKRKVAYGKEFRVFEPATVEELIAPLRDTGTDVVRIAKPNKPNVVLIIWESFTAKAVGLRKDGVEVTPNFNRYRNEGLFFSNAYASGDRTDKGIVAMLSGYPAQPLTSIIKLPAKTANLPKLPFDFKKAGYKTSFYYGGDPEFANMKSYLFSAGYDDLFTDDVFPESDRTSSWGAHDGAVMKKIVADLSRRQQPFFTTWLTLSSHEPYKVPAATAIPGSDDESLFLNSLHYSDSVINVLVQSLKAGTAWANTLIVITGDHGHPLPRTNERIDDFKSPILFLGGALSQIRNDSIPASQTDIAATLLGGLGLRHDRYIFSRNMLNGGDNRFAYFSFHNGFGFVKSGNYIIWDNVGRQIIAQHGTGPAQVSQGRALQQFLLKDYEER